MIEKESLGYEKQVPFTKVHKILRRVGSMYLELELHAFEAWSCANFQQQT